MQQLEYTLSNMKLIKLIKTKIKNNYIKMKIELEQVLNINTAYILKFR